MDIIEDIAVVEEVSAGKVKVSLPQTDSCKSCAVHGFCHATEAEGHWVETDLPLQQGDKVKMFIAPGLRIASSFIIFLLPVIMMLVFYLVSKYLISLSENLCILISILSLGVSGFLIWQLDKIWGKKVKYEIVGKYEEEEE